MEFGAISREIFIQATPETVFEVVTGFRERRWEAAVLEQQYQAHVTGWDHFLPRLAPYAATLRVHA